jgi:hypothetical protein
VVREAITDVLVEVASLGLSAEKPLIVCLGDAEIAVKLAAVKLNVENPSGSVVLR